MAAKRVDIIRIQKVKEGSLLYQNRRVNSPSSAADFFRSQLEDKDREHFMVAYLNTKYEPIAVETVSIGSLSSALVHPREVFKGALLSNCSCVLLGHNHPSGNVEPSKEDVKLTERLEQAGGILGISILDHIIIGDRSRYASFKERGLLSGI